jgi:hypothetical protein
LELLADCDAHPLLNRLVNEPEQPSIDAYSDGGLYVGRESTLDAIGSSNEESNPNASWRSMFITWPPLNDDELRVRYQMSATWPQNKTREFSCVVGDFEGITLGHFFYALYRCTRTSPLVEQSLQASTTECVYTAPRDWITAMPLGLYIEVLPAIPKAQLKMNRQ